MTGLRLLIIFFELLICAFLRSQGLNYDGLELYDTYMQNPAEIEAENNFQLDAIGYSHWIGFPGHPEGYLINSIGTIKKIHSSVRLSFENGTFAYSSDRTLNFGYAFKHPFNSDLSLGAGLNYSTGKIRTDDSYIDTSRPDIPTYYEQKTGSIDMGLALKYKRLSLGLNSRFTLINKVRMKYRNREDVKYSGTTGFNKIYFSSRYTIPVLKKFNITPEIAFDTYNDTGSEFTAKFYPGLLADYKEIVGIGAVHYWYTSFMAYAKLFKRFRIYIAVFNGKIHQDNVDLGWNFNGQLRINI